MEKIEICKDVNAISNSIEMAEKMQVKANDFYQYVTGLGYPLTVQQIRELYSNIFGNGYVRNSNFEGIATLFLKDRIAEKNSAKIEGLGFATNKTQLYKLIEVNETEIQGVVEHISNFIHEETGSFQYLEFADQTKTIELVKDYSMLITENLTVYSNNDKQIHATELLQIVADSLNDLNAFLNIGDQNVEGLIYVSKSYKIDPKYVQKIS
jgi:hypothetical protein